MIKRYYYRILYKLGLGGLFDGSEKTKYYGIIRSSESTLRTETYIYQSYEKAVENLPRWQDKYPHDKFTIMKFTQV